MTGTALNVVDSSGWLEFFADGPGAGFFAPVIERPDRLIVPTISLYEVFKRILQQRDESAALQAVAVMQQGRVQDLTPSLAVAAARIAAERRLPMVDAVMYATVLATGATLWTQDAVFAQLAGARYRPA